MRILYIITQSELGGAQRYIADLATGIKARHPEYSIGVIAGINDNGGFGDELKKSSVSFLPVPFIKRSIAPFGDLIAVFKLAKIIKKIKPDIIHLNSSKISVIGSWAARLANAKSAQKARVIYTAHGWVFTEPLGILLKKLYFWLEKTTAQFKDKIIVLNRDDWQIALNELLIPQEKLVLIHNGVNFVDDYFLERGQAREDLEKIAQQPLFTPNVLTIGAVANFYPTKGLLDALEATRLANISLAMQTGVNLKTRLVIIGDGAQRQALENHIRKYEMADECMFLGSVEQAARFLYAFDMYISSSVKEGLPYAILEAQAAGLPVIATATAGAREIIIDGETGLISPIGKPTDLAKNIVKLAKNTDLRATIGTHGIARVKEIFSKNQMINETEGVYFNKV